MAEKEPLRLKVAGAQQQDVGKGIVRVGQEQIRALALEQGDVVELRRKTATAAIAVPAYPQDEGTDIIRMDGLIRGNCQSRDWRVRQS
jgi:transitional endoplasmic reticulum ATPase